MMSRRFHMIRASGLSKRFGRFPAVDSVDLEIPRGEVVGFLGPNGAGKTTTIRMICGYLRPTAGSIVVDGLDVVRDRRGVQRRIGYLPESAPLYSEMRVGEYLSFRARLYGLRGEGRTRAIERAAERCGLKEVRRRPIHQLSRGYRQRVGLAAALLHEPPVIILDEPTAGLDPAQIRQFRQLLGELAGRHTILLSTHNLAEVELTCHRIIMLARGRVWAAGTLESLRTNAAAEGRYVVETDSPTAGKAVAGLPAVVDVQSVDLDHQWWRLTVTADSSRDLREEIARAVAGHGGALRELRREVPGLERLFVRVVAEAEVTPGPPGGNGP